MTSASQGQKLNTPAQTRHKSITIYTDKTAKNSNGELAIRSETEEPKGAAWVYEWPTWAWSLVPSQAHHRRARHGNGVELSTGYFCALLWTLFVLLESYFEYVEFYSEIFEYSFDSTVHVIRE